MRASWVAGAAAVLACALMTGCTPGADPAPEDLAPEDPATSATPAASEETAPSPSADATDPEESESQESDAEETESASASQSLAIEQRHPNGSVLRVTSLTIEPNAITVGIEVVNGATREFGLSPGGAVVSVTDDLGGTYEFLRPEDNPDLDIEARGTLTGELVYFGVLQPEATTLRLQTNASTGGAAANQVYDPTTESTNEPFPHFSVEIPLDS